MPWLLSSLKLPITDPTWIFFLVLVMILFAPMLLSRLRIPHIIGLIVAGVLNVGMNLIFTICFHMGVKGVALATVLAQCVSTFLVMRALMQKGTAYTISREKLRMDKMRLRVLSLNQTSFFNSILQLIKLIT